MRKLICTMLLTVMLLLIASCGEQTVRERNENGNLDVTPIENIGEYTLVRGDMSSDEEKSAISALAKAINSLTGAFPEVATDQSTAKGKEIIIGETNRKASSEAMEGLGYYDFVIRPSGDDLIIVGGSGEATLEAVNFYIKNFIDTEKQEIYTPIWDDGYTQIKSYAIEKLTIDGKNISELAVYNPYGASFAEDFADRLSREYVGAKIEVIDSALPENESGIVIKNDIFSVTEYALRIENGVLYIEGGYKSAEAAAEQLFALLDSKKGNVDLTSSDNFSGNTEGFTIPYSTKEDLMKILEYSYELEDKVIFGQHIAGRPTVSGILEEYYTAVGEYPAAIDFDMLDLPYKDDAYWSQNLYEIVEFASRGGIVTTMYHWANPADEGEYTERHYRGTLGSLEKWNEVLTEGSELNEKWMIELDTGAKFLGALKEAGVPVLFRPMHEANITAFWFCAPQGGGVTIPSEDMVNMWKYVYSYYTEDLGLDNLVWVYGPNVASSGTLPVDYYYPGDEYCDIVSLDWYTNGHYEVENSYNDIAKLGKITALAEFGVGDSLRAENESKQKELFNCEDYLEIINDMFKDGFKISYIQVYAGQYGSPAWLGNGEVLANSDMIINLPEMQEIIEKALEK